MVKQRVGAGCLAAVLLLLTAFSVAAEGEPAVGADENTRTYISSEAFTLDKNDGSNHWLWQYYNVTENTYSNMTMKHQDEHDADGSYPDYWLLPNPYASGDANNHTVCAAVGKEIMRGDYFGPEKDQSGKPIKYAAVKTFIVPADGTATLTHNIFKNIEAGQSRAKIMLNDKQIWPAEGWALSEYNGGFPDYPQDGVVTDVSRGDLIRFVFYNSFGADLGNGETGGRYNGGGKWDPVVTLKPPMKYSKNITDKAYWNIQKGNWDWNDAGVTQGDGASEGNRMFIGNQDWQNYSVSVSVTPVRTDGSVKVFAYYSDEAKNYSISIENNSVILCRGGKELQRKEFLMTAGENVRIHLEALTKTSGTQLNVQINDNDFMSYLDATEAISSGGIAMGTESVSCRFSEITFSQCLKEADYLSATVAEESLEKLNIQDVTDIENSLQKILQIKIETLKDILFAELNSRIEGTNTLTAEGNTIRHSVIIKGMSFSNREQEKEFVISGENFSKTISFSLDNIGRFEGEADMGTDAETGTYSVILKDFPEMRATFLYRKISNENIVHSFSINGSEAVISDKSIKVTLTKNADVRELVPVFKLSDYAKAYIGENEQISGRNMQDFSEPVIYTIKAENDDSTDYTVTVFPYTQGGGGSSGGGGSKGGSGGSSNVFSLPAVTLNPNVPPLVDAETDVEVSLPFDDMEDADWAKKSVALCYDKGIIGGNGDGKFEPNRNITRAEFVKMLVKAFNVSAGDKSVETFEDVSPDDWFYQYIRIGVSNEIVGGYGNGLFGPNDYITRQDMCVMLYRVCRDKLILSSQSEFSDMNDISEYALRSVTALAGAGVINGSGGSFYPKQNSTRAEAVAVIARVLEGGLYA